MTTLNNPLLLAGISAAISALITAIIETAITNRQKNSLERQLEDIRHKHTLEVEQLRHANGAQLEEMANQLRQTDEQARNAVEQRFVKLPKFIEASYRVRYLLLEIVNAAESKQEDLMRERINDLGDAVSVLSHDVYALGIKEADFYHEAGEFLWLCAGIMSLAGNAVRDLFHNSPSIFDPISELRKRYEEVKASQSRLMEMITRLDRQSHSA